MGKALQRMMVLILCVVCLFGVSTLTGCDGSKDGSEPDNHNNSLSSSDKTKNTLEQRKQAIYNKMDEVMKSRIRQDMTDLQKVKEGYGWISEEFKYRAMRIDLSKGYTQELMLELAEYFFKYRKGSCEHYAVVVKLFLERYGFEAMLVEGERYDRFRDSWGAHLWVIGKVNGKYYHFDGLYGVNHLKDTYKTFCIPDKVIEESHKWDKTKYPVCDSPQILE